MTRELFCDCGRSMSTDPEYRCPYCKSKAWKDPLFRDWHLALHHAVRDHGSLPVTGWSCGDCHVSGQGGPGWRGNESQELSGVDARSGPRSEQRLQQDVPPACGERVRCDDFRFLMTNDGYLACGESADHDGDHVWTLRLSWPKAAVLAASVGSDGSQETGVAS